MGIILELYRMSDSDIEELRKLNTEDQEEYLNENYSNIYARYHKEDDIVFYMDKGWDIAIFLLKDKDTSEDKILQALDGTYIESREVRSINTIFEVIINERIKDSCDREKMIENRVYRSNKLEPWGGDDFWRYIDFHLQTFKAAFARAAELNEGIVLNRK